jgi:hypothetical protein
VIEADRVVGCCPQRHGILKKKEKRKKMKEERKEGRNKRQIRKEK